MVVSVLVVMLALGLVFGCIGDGVVGFRVGFGGGGGDGVGIKTRCVPFTRASGCC